MHNPTLPTSQSKDSIHQTLTTLHSQPVRLNRSLEKNHENCLILEENSNEQSFYTINSQITLNSQRSILKKTTKFESTEMSQSEKCENKKNIRFAQTRVHEVENWKHFNRQREPCCLCFLF